MSAPNVVAHSSERAETNGSADAPVRGGDLLVEALIRAGVEQLFGVPGDTGVVFYDALSRRSDQIRHVLARDERHAAAMADAFARVRGQVGVVEVSSGGGTTYVVGGLGEAYASGTPLLVVTSDIHRNSRGTGALTEIDQRALFSAVTKQVFHPESASEIPTAVRDALDVATSGRPGPVAVVVPEDVLDETVSADFEVDPGSVAVPRMRATARKGDVERAAAILASAQRPAFVAGSGVHYSRAYDDLAAICERLGAGVATSIHGKGAIPDANPWALGVTGNNGGGKLAIEYLRTADVVVVVGSRANATDTDSYTAPPRTAHIIGVDVEPARIARNYPNALTLAGDAQTVIRQLLAALPTPDAEAVEQRRADIARRRQIPPDMPRSDPGAGRLHVDDVLDALADTLAAVEPIVVADPGAPTPAVANRYPVRKAGRNVVIPRGHGPMGFALPAAVGVCLAEPGRTVLALTADGSFAMSCGELETIARFRLPVIAVQLTNHSLGWIKMLQHLYQGERYFGVDPGPIDAVGVARACGLRAERPRSLAELRANVSQALTNGLPLYLDVEVPHMIEVVPQVPAWHRALQGDRTRPIY